jgi:phage gp46-like protein
MDIALNFDTSTLLSDVAIVRGDLEAEKDLATAIILSLFSDARARDDDPLEPGESKRGYWGDTYAEIDKDKFGSRLWLLRREKVVAKVLVRAKQYAQEALQWLIDDRVAEKITVTTEIIGKSPNGILGIRVEVKKPNQTTQSYQFDYAWEQI